jgi:hypothetical protein
MTAFAETSSVWMFVLLMVDKNNNEQALLSHLAILPAFEE